MATTRVYILAKELGVKSSAIVKKCQDEDLDVKNHMSVISAGLAATIREWFSEGENVTTVETSDKVDLEKVRVKKKKKTAKKSPARKTKAQETETAEPEIEPETEKVVEAPSAAEEPETEQGQKAVAVSPEEQQEEEPVPPEPEPIVPAGPILEKPEPARLSGPRVVRVEAPEPIVRRRPKPRSRPRYDAPVTEPLMYSQQEGENVASASQKDKKHSTKRHKEGTYSKRRDELDPDLLRKSKLSSKWRQRDIEERQATIGPGWLPARQVEPKAAILACLRSSSPMRWKNSTSLGLEPGQPPSM